MLDPLFYARSTQVSWVESNAKPNIPALVAGLCEVRNVGFNAKDAEGLKCLVEIGLFWREGREGWEMKCQWDCVLENLGVWVGSFTVFSAEGVQIEDIPSVISLVGTKDNTAIELVLKRFYAVAGEVELAASEVAMSFSSPDPGAVFFDTGAFSSGGLSVRRGERAIAEFCLVGVDRRCRLVQVYSAVTQRLDRVTLIREQRQGTNAVERPHLTIADLGGYWQGNKIVSGSLDAELVTNVPTKSKLVANTDRTYYWDDDDTSILLTATNDKLLTFDLQGQSYQMLLLPDAAYSICPTQINHGHHFYVEMGWLLAPGLRHRLVRRYDSTGKWADTAWIIEQNPPT